MIEQAKSIYGLFFINNLLFDSLAFILYFFLHD